MAVIGHPDRHDRRGAGSLLVELDLPRRGIDVDELAFAREVGFARDAAAKRAGWARTRRQSAAVSRENNAFGACGEFVVACALGIVWEHRIGQPGKGPDVGPWNVRATRTGHLLVTPGERGRFVLVELAYPRYAREFRLAGWVDLADDPDDEWLTAPDPNRPPAFLLPVGQLGQWCDAPDNRPDRWFTRVDPHTFDVVERFPRDACPTL